MVKTTLVSARDESRDDVDQPARGGRLVADAKPIVRQRDRVRDGRRDQQRGPRAALRTKPAAGHREHSRNGVRGGVMTDFPLLQRRGPAQP